MRLSLLTNCKLSQSSPHGPGKVVIGVEIEEQTGEASGSHPQYTPWYIVVLTQLMEGIFLLALCNSAAMGALQHTNVSMGKVGLWIKNYIKRHRQFNSDVTIESSILQG